MIRKMMTRLARESSVFHRLIEIISNDCIFSAFLIKGLQQQERLPLQDGLAPFDGALEDAHEGTGGHEDQQDADDQAVQTGGFSQGAA